MSGRATAPDEHGAATEWTVPTGRAPVEAVDLTWETMPRWLQAATFQRWGRPHKDPPSWQALYRSAIDVAPFDAVGRRVLCVLVDWHTNGARSVARSLALDVAPRVPCTAPYCRTMVRRLAADGWLGVQKRPGSPDMVTLTVPVENPVAAARTQSLSDCPPSHSVTDTQSLSDCHPVTQLLTQGDRGTGGQKGDARSSSAERDLAGPVDDGPTFRRRPPAFGRRHLDPLAAARARARSRR